jgi:Sec-independent protein translocase protein TatA
LLGSQDLIVGLVSVVVLFGAKKIPELAAYMTASAHAWCGASIVRSW